MKDICEWEGLGTYGKVNRAAEDEKEDENQSCQPSKCFIHE